MEHENWETPEFVKIKTKKSKRISPYLESEIWEKEELLSKSNTNHIDEIRQL
jgi:hypothetical protein